MEVLVHDLCMTVAQGIPESASAESSSEFVLAHLPPPAARVLEVGCGDGRLAELMASAGYVVTAVDPEAPEGPIFRQIKIEDFAESGPFDAAVAVCALHHVDEVGAALDRIVEVLRPDGLLILEEFAKERFEDDATARWYYHERQALHAADCDRRPVPDTFDLWLAEERYWMEQHGDIHSFEKIRRMIDTRFAKQFFARTPYLYGWELDDTLEVLERKLIASGKIQATGIRYVGERR